MGLFDFFSKKEPLKVMTSEGYHAYSTPFMPVGGANLSLPYVSQYRNGRGGIVYFGEDNLYPQLLTQMYFQSPLHGAIIDFKVRSVVGGGYEIDKEGLTPKELVDVKAFEIFNKFKTLPEIVGKELLVHGRVYFKLYFSEKHKLKKVKIVSADKVRRNYDGSRYAISLDWSTQVNIEEIKPYHPECRDACQLYVYEQHSLGQDIYPLPQYTSALNWAFLDGEMSYLHKSNILNSIFPSFAFMFPKKPSSKEEENALRQTIDKGKGAANAGKVLAFFSNGTEYLPKIEAIPTNQNDQLFLQTDERIDAKICQAHGVDPMVFGIRVSGKLGGGTDIKQAYVIFEKNFVMPTRDEIEGIFNDILRIGELHTKLTFNNFQIINEAIIEDVDEGNVTSDALNAMSPLVATKVLNSMTENEIRALAGLAPIEGGDVVKKDIIQ
jgi:hypothetical protein